MSSIVFARKRKTHLIIPNILARYLMRSHGRKRTGVVCACVVSPVIVAVLYAHLKSVSAIIIFHVQLYVHGNGQNINIS